MKYIKLILIISSVLLLSLHSVSSVRAVDCADTDVSSDRYTLSGSCSFPGALLDGIDANGGSTNSAILTVTSGVTLTIPAQQTLATGIIDLKGGGSIVIVKNGQIKLKTPIYMTDSDNDHYPASASGILIPNAADKRKYTISNPASVDCKDTGISANLVYISKTCYIDRDGDTYTTGTKTCTNDSNCLSATYASTGSNDDVENFAGDPINKLTSGSSGSDCNDTGINSSNVYQSLTCYGDSDNDNYGTGTAKTCMGKRTQVSVTCDTSEYSSGGEGTTATATVDNYSSNATDCNDTGTNSANVYVSATCYADTDNDDYGIGAAKTCTNNATCGSATFASGGEGTAANSVASTYSSDNTDCNDTGTNSTNVYKTKTCYIDSDGDNYGGTTSKACVGNSSHAVIGVNCAAANWGSAASDGSVATGPYAFLNSNDDCWDGHASYNTTCEPLAFGDGRDGQDLTYTDADYAPSVVASTANTSAGSSTIVTTSNISGLAQGDIVLIANLQGTSGAYTDVGEYDFKLVNSVNTGTKTITFFTNLANGYNGTTQKIIVQKIPQYTNITVSGAITPTAWGGTSGGIFAIKATGTISVPSGTSINTNGIGYTGAASPADSTGGSGGESFCGTGGGTGASFGVNGGDGACGGGGGGGSKSGGTSGGAGSATGGAGGGGGRAGSTTAQRNGGGAGGGYGSAGALATLNGSSGGSGTSGNGGGGIVYADPSSAYGGGGGGGGTYGAANLSSWFFGSGGGAGASLSILNGGAGGNGGGIVYIAGSTVTITSTGTISADGANGGALQTSGNSTSGAGGGGAGGSIYILGNTVTLGTSLVTASNGTKGGTNAGNGGNGRIAVGATTKTGTTSPTYTSITAP